MRLIFISHDGNIDKILLNSKSINIYMDKFTKKIRGRKKLNRLLGLLFLFILGINSVSAQY